MGGGASGFNASALVDGDVDDHGTFFHPRNHFLCYELRSGGAGDEHAANQQVRLLGSLRNGVRVRGLRAHVAAENVVELAQAVQVHVNDSDVGAEAESHLGRIRADDAAADDHNVRGRDSGDAAEEDAASTFFFFQIAGPDLHGHAACDFRHGSQQRKGAVFVSDSFVGDAGDLLGEQLV